MPAIPDTYYLVLDFGKHGRESTINWDACSKADILDQLTRQDYRGSLVEVHCIDRNDGTWCDVSEDIARDVMDALDTEPVGDLLDWLTAQLGHHKVAEVA